MKKLIIFSSIFGYLFFSSHIDVFGQGKRSIISLPSGARQLTPNLIPSTVFRVDRRTPEVIFRDGFQVYGSNSALSEHVAGVSCNTGGRDGNASANSSFIATTSEELGESFSHYGMAIVGGLNPSEGDILYAYAIRPTRNFYSGALSIRDYLLDHRNLGAAGLTLVDMVRAEDLVEEWVSHGSIPTEQIEYALMFRFTRAGVWAQIGERVENQRYKKDKPDANPGPFTKIFSYDPDHSDDTEPQPGTSSRQKRDINTTLTPYGYYIQGTKYNSCFGDAQSPIEKRFFQKNGTSTFLSLLSDVIPVI